MTEDDIRSEPIRADESDITSRCPIWSHLDVTQSLGLLENDVGARLSDPVGQLLALGADESRSAVHRVIPAVLATFARIATTPSGASALSAAAERASSACRILAGGKWTVA